MTQHLRDRCFIESGAEIDLGRSNVIIVFNDRKRIRSTNGKFNYWVGQKVCTDFEGKLKRRKFKFLISFIKFKSFAA